MYVWITVEKLVCVLLSGLRRYQSRHRAINVLNDKTLRILIFETCSFLEIVETTAITSSKINDISADLVPK